MTRTRWVAVRQKLGTKWASGGYNVDTKLGTVGSGHQVGHKMGIMWAQSGHKVGHKVGTKLGTKWASGG